MSEEIKPCPFCGSDEIIMCIDMEAPQWMSHLMCESCCAAKGSDVFPTQDESELATIAEWNRRPKEARDTEAHALEQENAELKSRVAELEATQTRWVLCAERMPTVVNNPENPYLVMLAVADRDGVEQVGRALADLCAKKLVPINYGFMPKNMRVVAWAENLPEFVPEAKP